MKVHMPDNNSWGYGLTMLCGMLFLIRCANYQKVFKETERGMKGFVAILSFVGFTGLLMDILNDFSIKSLFTFILLIGLMLRGDNMQKEIRKLEQETERP